MRWIETPSTLYKTSWEKTRKHRGWVTTSTNKRAAPLGGAASSGPNHHSKLSGLQSAGRVGRTRLRWVLLALPLLRAKKWAFWCVSERLSFQTNGPPEYQMGSSLPPVPHPSRCRWAVSWLVFVVVGPVPAVAVISGGPLPVAASQRSKGGLPLPASVPQKLPSSFRPPNKLAPDWGKGTAAPILAAAMLAHPLAGIRQHSGR